MDIDQLLKIPPEERSDEVLRALDSLTVVTSFFDSMSRPQRLAMLQHVTVEYHTAGSVVYHFGDVGVTAYIVLRGAVSVRFPDPVTHREIEVRSV